MPQQDFLGQPVAAGWPHSWACRKALHIALRILGAFPCPATIPRLQLSLHTICGGFTSRPHRFGLQLAYSNQQASGLLLRLCVLSTDLAILMAESWLQTLGFDRMPRLQEFLGLVLVCLACHHCSCGATCAQTLLVSVKPQTLSSA